MLLRLRYGEELKQELKTVAPELGIDDIGFASAEPFESLKGILQNHRDKGYESGFEESDLDKRVTPALPGTKPKSLIAIAITYHSRWRTRPNRSLASTGDYGAVCGGRDYHQVLREAMSRLEEYIKERVPDAKLESMVDTGALVDRAVSRRAGIGFSAKNCAIISEARFLDIPRRNGDQYSVSAGYAGNRGLRECTAH